MTSKIPKESPESRRITVLETDIKKMKADNTTALKLSTKLVRENAQLKIALARLTTRINTNEDNIRQFRSKR